MTLRPVHTLTLLALLSHGCGNIVNSGGATWLQDCDAEGCEVERDTLRLGVPEGALPEQIRITVEATDPPIPGAVSRAFRVRPEALEFPEPGPAPLIAFELRAADVPPDVDPRSLRVARAVDGQWALVDEGRNELNGDGTAVEAELRRLGVFALITHKPVTPTPSPSPTPTPTPREDPTPTPSPTLLPTPTPTPTAVREGIGMLFIHVFGSRPGAPANAAIGSAAISLFDGDMLLDTQETDETGRFEFRSLPAKTLRVRIEAPPIWKTVERQVTVNRDETTQEDFDMAIADDAPAELSGIIRIAGSEEGLSEVTVQLTGSGDQGRFEGVTDLSGFYRVEGLPPGDYRVGTVHPGFEAGDESLTLRRGEIAALDFSLPRKLASIEGRVIDSVTSQGIDAAELTLRSIETGLFEETTESDRDGSYSFQDAPFGEYELLVNAQLHQSEAQHVTIEMREQHIPDIVLTPIYGTIEGIVAELPGNETADDVTVTLVFNSVEDSTQTATDQRGRFEFVQVLEGNHQLRFEREDLGVELRDVQVVRAEQSFLQVALAPVDLPRGTVEGNVIDMNSGLAIEKVRVEAQLNDGFVAAAQVGDREGNYRLELIVEDYEIVVSHPRYQTVRRSVNVTDNGAFIEDFMLQPVASIPDDPPME